MNISFVEATVVNISMWVGVGTGIAMCAVVVNARIKHLICILFRPDWLYLKQKQMQCPEFCIGYNVGAWYVSSGRHTLPTLIGIYQKANIQSP